MSGSITGAAPAPTMTGGQFGIPPQVLQALMQRVAMGGAAGGAPAAAAQGVPMGAGGAVPGPAGGMPGAVPGPAGAAMPGAPPPVGPAPMGAGAGPMPGAMPGQAPAPGPQPAGGGVGPSSLPGPQSGAPMTPQGVPSMGPRRFSGVPVPPGASRAPGGQNAPGGATPFSIHPLKQPAMTASQMASAGRFGDSVIAHLTPGEVQIPPELLQGNPALYSALQDAFRRTGADISQFTAGSPNTTRNPTTGAEENSLWSALLPIVGAALGTFLLPGLGTGVGAALGGAGGGAVGGMIDHASPMGILAQAGLGGLGGYAGGGGFGSLGGLAPSSAATTAAPTALAANAASMGGVPLVPTAAGIAAPGIEAAGPTFMGALKQGLWAGAGSTLGSMLAPQDQNTTSQNNDPNFNNPNAGWSNRTPGQILGSGASRTPSFTGYNPYTSVTGYGGTPGYNFFPPTSG